MKFPGAIQLYSAQHYTFINNSIAGSEKAGLKFKGVPCEDMNAADRLYGNEVKRWLSSCCCYYCDSFTNIVVVVFALKILLLFPFCFIASVPGLLVVIPS